MKSQNLNIKTPKPPALLVHGGAGCGKTTVINILKQWIHVTLQKAGDDPSMPYILVTAPTGTEAANVKGQTLHTCFGFHFGNNYISLSDKKRDEKRCLLQNLKFLVIDEKSMVKSDMFFQLDRRLREITQKTDEFMGGIALLGFGDILQLKPCMGRYAFDQPQCEDFQLRFECDPIWDKFDVISLVENHRQESDYEYANMLNRIRVGQPTEADLEKLRERTRPKNHPDLRGAMVIDCTNAGVNRWNKKGLGEISGDLIEIEAINIHPTIKNFKPPISEKKGTVKDTPFLQTLQLKISAKIMLTFNINTIDGLTNGARGMLVDVVKLDDGSVSKLIIQFEDPSVGQISSQSHLKHSTKYPGCTVIGKTMFQYSLAKKSSMVSNCAKVVQFPVVLCFAATAHKFQGQTIVKPLKLLVDLRSVFEAAQSYVMLSRVQSIDQLYILEYLPTEKLYASIKALHAVEMMEIKSINKNPTPWFKLQPSSFKVASLNCRSLRKHIQDIRGDPMLLKANIICLSETWISEAEDVDQYHIDGYQLHLNSVGKGKGLAIYFKGISHAVSEVILKEDKLQISKIIGEVFDVITIYRSNQGNQDTLVNAVKCSMSFDKPNLVVGDINLCAVSDKESVASRGLRQLGFTQMVTRSTHIKGDNN